MPRPAAWCHQGDDQRASGPRLLREQTVHTRGAFTNRTWAELMQRSFGFDVLACPRCPGRLKLVALIQDGTVVQRILRHLGLPTVVPEMRPSRAPPLPFEVDDDGVLGDDY